MLARVTTRTDLEPGAEETLGYQLKRAEQALHARKTEALRVFDLTVPQYTVMELLLGTPSQSCTHLAREALVTSQTMGGIVNNLEAKGLVRRRVSPDHKRVHLISLTDDGFDLARQAHEVAGAVERDLSDAFSAKERAQLHKLLDRIAEAAPGAG